MSGFLAVCAVIGAFFSDDWQGVALVAILAALAVVFHFFP